MRLHEGSDALQYRVDFSAFILPLLPCCDDLKNDKAAGVVIYRRILCQIDYQFIAHGEFPDFLKLRYDPNAAVVCLNVNGLDLFTDTCPLNLCALSPDHGIGALNTLAKQQPGT